jgi:photosystem II stability/assembly factor-like uncharacterized protein
MKNLFFLFCGILYGSLSTAQSTWQTLPNAPSGGRWDDVFFTDSLHGWAGGSSGMLYKTTDAGATWTSVYNSSNYIRCVEFYDTLSGFVGTLDKKFLRTTNGGQTWTDLASTINPKPQAICGLSLVGNMDGYAVGEWDSPGFLLKTTDGGNTWISKDMSAYANALVDVFFISPDTGFVTGKSNTGATILYTTDGGASWTEKYNSGTAGQYVWKIQRVTPLTWVGSVQTFGGGKFVKSNDGGMTWQSLSAPVPDMQGIGFATPEHGWVGGYVSGFWETNDGGQTWNYVQFGANFNRFYFLSPNLAYASGSSIYKFATAMTSTVTPPPIVEEVSSFWLKASPNPTSGRLQVQFFLPTADIIRIDLLTAQGASLRNLYHRRLESGEYTFEVDISEFPAGSYFLGIQRNHGLEARALYKSQ